MMSFTKLKSNITELLARWSGGRPPPHYVRDYRKHVKSLLAAAPEVDAMRLAVGGEFHSFGTALKDLVIESGLKEHMTVVDVGCGSGRLAYALRDMSLNYTGTDVVPKLIRYAKELCQRPDWRFEVVTGLNIPMPDASADMVIFISVFTHLRHEDFSQASHWCIFERYVDTIRAGKAPMHVDQFIDKSAISVWANQLGFEVKKIFDGGQNYIRLSQEIIRDDGSKWSGDITIGQSTCLLQKR